MSSPGTVGKAQQARLRLLEAHQEASLITKLKLYQESSRLYLEAVNEVDDNISKQTMIYLANSALAEALRTKSYIDVTKHSHDTIILPKGVSSTSDREVVSEYCKRIVMSAHLERIKGLEKVILGEILDSFFNS